MAHFVSFTTTEKDKQALQDEANERGLTLAAHVRDLVRRGQSQNELIDRVRNLELELEAQANRQELIFRQLLLRQTLPLYTGTPEERLKEASASVDRFFAGLMVSEKLENEHGDS